MTEYSSMQPRDTIGRLPHYYFSPFITLAHMFHAEKGWAIHNREMTQFVLQYVVDGYARYIVEGTPYETRRGDLLFHRPYERHSILTSDNEPYVCISLVFHFGEDSFPYEDLFRHQHLLGNYAQHAVENMLSLLVEHYRQPGLVHQMHCQSLLLQIMAEASSQVQGASGSHNQTGAGTVPKLVLIKNYMHEHYGRTLQINELEEVAGISKSHILALFRKHVGMSPMQYLTWVRINKARELAIRTNLSASQIAEHVGYADVHTFGRMFKKKTGQSLTQFCANLIYS